MPVKVEPSSPSCLNTLLIGHDETIENNDILSVPDNLLYSSTIGVASQINDGHDNISDIEDIACNTNQDSANHESSINNNNNDDSSNVITFLIKLPL